MSENSEFKNTRIQEWDLVLGPIPFDEELHDEHDEFFESAVKEAKRRFMISLAMKKVRHDAASGLYDGTAFKVSEMIQNTQKARMITVSLPPFSPNEISDRVSFYNKKLTKMKFLVTGTKWVYEQRGDSDETKYTGIHIHIIAPKTKKFPNEIIRDMSKQLNISNNFINIIDVRLQDADNYLLAEKKGAKKQSRQKYDIIMRTEFNIEKVYLK